VGREMSDQKESRLTSKLSEQWLIIDTLKGLKNVQYSGYTALLEAMCSNRAKTKNN
jgi:hypothetical protein